MGAATRHKRSFLTEHPLCVFCGGREPATSIEHCPPRALFQNRQWPEGFEFPSCSSCNEGTSNEDLLVAMLSRMNPFGDEGNEDGKTHGLISAVKRQYPDLPGKLTLSPREARRHNQALGLLPAPGQLHQETGIIAVTPEMHAAVSVVGGKLLKGLYYRYARKAFPSEGCILLHWFTNVEIVKNGTYPIFEQMQERFQGDAPVLRRAGVELNEQFSYKLTIDPLFTVVALQATFGRSFGILVFAHVDQGVLEGMVCEMRSQFPEKKDLFFVLQSNQLPPTWAQDSKRREEVQSTVQEREELIGKPSDGPLQHAMELD